MGTSGVPLEYLFENFGIYEGRFWRGADFYLGPQFCQKFHHFKAIIFFSFFYSFLRNDITPIQLALHRNPLSLKPAKIRFPQILLIILSK